MQHKYTLNVLFAKTKLRVKFSFAYQLHLYRSPRATSNSMIHNSDYVIDQGRKLKSMCFKKIISTVLCVVLVFGLLPNAALAVETDTSGPVLTVVSCDKQNETLYEREL